VTNKGFGPMLEIARIQSEINRIFDNLLRVDAEGGDAGGWIPLVDIHENEEVLTVSVELPGVAAADLSVTTHGGDVILTGEKRRPSVGSPARFHVAERAFGRFRRVIHLGVPVNTHRAEAVFAAGTLRLKFPKVANRRGEEVAIKVTAA
jgi:HSP20 family protein